ncbi:hypothetical protein BD410DRAFT_808358 [Rickenella mellea]|uniref:Uncharacterized protein n=1 Tax=Rickenella mellea TaxID=50990 RepID=A0A4Y7PM29_9AGAM|nr:hypothetical protein BD410DRAFT_808358 [Rickenella mellea]
MKIARVQQKTMRTQQREDKDTTRGGTMASGTPTLLHRSEMMGGNQWQATVSNAGRHVAVARIGTKGVDGYAGVSWAACREGDKVGWGCDICARGVAMCLKNVGCTLKPTTHQHARMLGSNLLSYTLHKDRRTDNLEIYFSRLLFEDGICVVGSAGPPSPPVRRQHGPLQHTILRTLHEHRLRTRKLKLFEGHFVGLSFSSAVPLDKDSPPPERRIICVHYTPINQLMNVKNTDQSELIAYSFTRHASEKSSGTRYGDELVEWH